MNSLCFRLRLDDFAGTYVKALHQNLFHYCSPCLLGRQKGTWCVWSHISRALEVQGEKDRKRQQPTTWGSLFRAPSSTQLFPFPTTIARVLATALQSVPKWAAPSEQPFCTCRHISFIYVIGVNKILPNDWSREKVPMKFTLPYNLVTEKSIEILLDNHPLACSSVFEFVTEFDYCIFQLARFEPAGML